jgi:hypothetical protein
MVAFCGIVVPTEVVAQGPWGEIRAEPNPCRIEPGREECTSHVTWHTRGVERAKVFVTSRGRREEKEREFGDGRECESERCRAGWIRPETTYTFQLFDFTRGDRGRLLSSVTVTGERVR